MVQSSHGLSKALIVNVNVLLFYLFGLSSVLNNGLTCSIKLSNAAQRLSSYYHEELGHKFVSFGPARNLSNLAQNFKHTSKEVTEASVHAVELQVCHENGRVVFPPLTFLIFSN